MDTLRNLLAPEIRVFKNLESLFQTTAFDFFKLADIRTDEKKEFTVVLSGGKTPISLFDALAKGSPDIDLTDLWQHTYFFFSDERYVSEDDPESNYHTAHHYLFSKVPIPKKNIFKIDTTFTDPKDSATDYERRIREFFQHRKGKTPKFDLVYLGLGADGHTASLMPGSKIVKDYTDDEESEKNTKLVESLSVSSLMNRITLTPTALNNSNRIIFLVTGKSKAEAVRQVIEGPRNPQQYPAQLVQRIQGFNIWNLDEEAASELRNRNDLILM